jgi:beta-lactamase class A
MPAVSTALFDYETGAASSCDGDRWFHAASTIKIAVLACVYQILDEGHVDTGHPLLVVNRFRSAVDGTPFSVPASSDTDAAVHASTGAPMGIGELARRMIALSSNLATNVLLDYLGVDRARTILEGAGIRGVDLVRGVEDERAFAAGICNRVSANGLVGLLRAILEGRFGSAAHTAEMLEILSGQTIRHGIPAGLPEPVRAAARIAHKTGDITTATHDAGIVFLPGRAPYVLAVLTEGSGTTGERYGWIAEVSARVFEAACPLPTCQECQECQKSNADPLPHAG